MIATIRNKWLRRAILLAYLPVFTLLAAMLLLAAFIYMIVGSTLEKSRDVVWVEIKDSWRLFRRVWDRPDPC